MIKKILNTDMTPKKQIFCPQKVPCAYFKQIEKQIKQIEK
jgi:hypothetical protein